MRRVVLGVLSFLAVILVVIALFLSGFRGWRRPWQPVWAENPSTTDQSSQSSTPSASDDQTPPPGITSVCPPCPPESAVNKAVKKPKTVAKRKPATQKHAGAIADQHHPAGSVASQTSTQASALGARQTTSTANSP